MTKSDIVTRIAANLEVSDQQAKRFVREFLEVVAGGLEKEAKVELRGFGTFTITETAARKGRNPKTGESLLIAASRFPRFRASKELKDRCNSR